MLELFVVGTLWFWLALAASSVAIIAFVEHGKGTGATLTAALTLYVLAAVNGWFGVIADEPLVAAVGLAGYVLVGTGYAIVKWWSWVRAQRAELDRRIAAALARRNVTSIEELLKKRDIYGKDVNLESFWDEVQGRTITGGYKVTRAAPQASEHKARILTWMSYWPWSATWTLINDPVRRLFLKIYDAVSAQLQRIADRAWQGVPQ